MRSQARPDTIHQTLYRIIAHMADESEYLQKRIVYETPAMMKMEVTKDLPYKVVDGVRASLDTLPGDWGQALEELQADEVIQAAMGQHVYERYVEAKSQEWNEYRLYVSQWELDRYLTRY